MSNSVYKVMEVIGSSFTSWEEAAKTAVEQAGIHRRTCAWLRRRAGHEDRQQADCRIRAKVKLPTSTTRSSEARGATAGPLPRRRCRGLRRGSAVVDRGLSPAAAWCTLEACRSMCTDVKDAVKCSRHRGLFWPSRGGGCVLGLRRPRGLAEIWLASRRLPDSLELLGTFVRPDRPGGKPRHSMSVEAAGGWEARSAPVSPLLPARSARPPGQPARRSPPCR